MIKYDGALMPVVTGRLFPPPCTLYSSKRLPLAGPLQRRCSQQAMARCLGFVLVLRSRRTSSSYLACQHVKISAQTPTLP